MLTYLVFFLECSASQPIAAQMLRAGAEGEGSRLDCRRNGVPHQKNQQK
jgi:hypothetical protein